MHDAIRVRHYSRRTEEAYVHWIKRLIYFHGKRHPETMGEAEVTAFLKYEPARISPIEVHLRIPAGG